MRLLDNLRTRLSPARDKVSHLAQKHEGKIQHGLDRAAHTVDRKTKGKYSDKIQSGTGRAKHAMDRLAHHDGGHTPPTPGGGTTPPPPAS
ncbi:antitoxin [Streptomyces sp. DSM 3412]|uniref:Antitoxin n=1 Tax=Streptomyces gottesmaniae TaxID=3075518 RepID=A0ABU2YWI2_9ACTN|nr:antitoxin [Streptomyces sp. DSM 3412]MDT0568690.1 antitoxin [Streptomyces sp. DSM 3412]